MQPGQLEQTRKSELLQNAPYTPVKNQDKYKTITAKDGVDKSPGGLSVDLERDEQCATVGAEPGKDDISHQDVMVQMQNINNPSEG